MELIEENIIELRRKCKEILGIDSIQKHGNMHKNRHGNNWTNE